MDKELIVVTPSQLKAIVVDALSIVFESYQPPNPLQQGVDKWMTIEELSDYLPGKPAITTLYGKVQRREIPCSKPGGKRLTFLKSDIDQWLKGQRRNTQNEINAAAEQYVLANKKRRKQ